MRRTDKELTILSDIEEIIHASIVCRLAMSDGVQPYVVPMNFGYENRTLFFHSANTGKKAAILKKNDSVCVEFDTCIAIRKHEQPCKWSTSYSSVIVTGKALFIEDYAEKSRAMSIIAKKYTGSIYEFTEKQIADLCVFKVIIEEMTAKKS